MKKTLSLLLSFLLCLSVLFSCTPVTDDEAPEGIVGYWYSKDAQAVLAVTDQDGKAIFYSLAAGYYEYNSSEEITYTYRDGALTFTLDGEEYRFVYDGEKDALTLNDKISYNRRDQAPTEHPVYAFPNFAAINADSLLTLGDYKTLNLVSPALEEARIEIFEEYYEDADYPTITGRPAQQGDFVNIDYSGSLNGVVFNGGTASDVDLTIIENNGYIPGFVDGIIGHSVGETFDVTVTFPENYGESTLAGQAAVFTMTLNSIYDLTLSDEDILGSEDWAEYGSYQALLNARAHDIASVNISAALDAIVTPNAELPEECYLYFYQYYMDYYNYLAASYGMELSTLLYYYGMTEATVRSQAKQIALSYLASYAVAAKENLTWSEASYTEAYEEMVEEMLSEDGNTKTEAEVRAYINENQLPYLHAELMRQTVMDWLLEQNFHLAE